jgi:hypothetical protein
MSKKKLRSATGVVKDSKSIETFEPMNTLKPDDIVVIIHAEDYRNSFESMIRRINDMDEKVTEQSMFLTGDVKEKNKGFLGRLKIRK